MTFELARGAGTITSTRGTRSASGDQLNVRRQDSWTKKLRAVTFHYAGIVREFPTAPKDSFFVSDLDYVARATGSDAVGAFSCRVAHIG